MMTLYHYYRSTASYRVRIALALKNLPYESVAINLIPAVSEQYAADYAALNPQQLVPTLVLADGQVLTQSLAIIEYLDTCYPTPALLPQNPVNKALIRSLSMLIACDMHPLNNVRVLQQLKKQFHAEEADITQWYHHWLACGFTALETRLQSLPREQPVCFGDTVSMADLCVVAQMYNAKRFHFSMDPYPILQAIEAHCLQMTPFKEAAP